MPLPLFLTLTIVSAISQQLQATAETGSSLLSLGIFERPQFLFYKLTEDELSQCHNTPQACYSCINTCSYQPGSREDNAQQARLQQASMVKEVDMCHTEYLKLRTGLPDWCFNRGTEFYTTPDFEPTHEVCGLMSKKRCAEQWMNDLEVDVQMGKLGRKSREYATGKMAVKYAYVLEEIEREKRELEQIPKLAKQYSEEKDRNLLEQAMRHLRNPSLNDTVYSNPVYIGLDKIQSENNNWDREISKNDLYMAGIQNMFVRKSTVDRIPHILGSISKLHNQVYSKRSEIDKSLEEIKEISKKVAELQSQTTNLRFESTHVRNADGTIETLDDELISLYETLREERTILRDLNKQNTEAKAQLLDIMRELVREISRQQERKGCGTADVMFQ